IITVDTLPLKFPAPPYVAVIARSPTVSVLVVSVTCPAALSVPLPSEGAPSRNVTVPVAVPFPAATAPTVAVNLTGSSDACGPSLGCATDEVRAVVVTDFVPVSSRPGDVLVLNELSPP